MEKGVPARRSVSELCDSLFCFRPGVALGPGEWAWCKSASSCIFLKRSRRLNYTPLIRSYFSIYGLQYRNTCIVHVLIHGIGNGTDTKTVRKKSLQYSH